jgi:hypothetical protein
MPLLFSYSARHPVFSRSSIAFRFRQAFENARVTVLSSAGIIPVRYESTGLFCFCRVWHVNCLILSFALNHRRSRCLQQSDRGEIVCSGLLPFSLLLLSLSCWVLLTWPSLPWGSPRFFFSCSFCCFLWPFWDTSSGALKQSYEPYPCSPGA